MKQLQLELNKRLLIVEYPSIDFADGIELLSEFSEKYKTICKGSELTEDIAEDLVSIFDLSYFVDYNGHSPRCYVDTALESFISAIESEGWHWDNNPEDKFINNELNKYWFEEEQKNFNPEKTLILEIL